MSVLTERIMAAKLHTEDALADAGGLLVTQTALENAQSNLEVALVSAQHEEYRRPSAEEYEQ